MFPLFSINVTLSNINVRAPTPPDYLAIKEGPGIKAVWISPVPELIVGEIKTCADAAGVEAVRIPGYWLEKGGAKGKDVAPAAPGEKVLYTMHGGGYHTQSAHPSDVMSYIPLGLLQYSNTVSRALCLEYRLTKNSHSKPVNPFPAALIDAVAGYNYLVNVLGFEPANIIIEGDSAGGNLALALTRYLVENRGRGDVKLPAPPGGLMLNSPWCDLTGSDHHDGSTVFAHRGTDYLDITTAEFLGWIDEFVGPLNEEKRVGAANRYISPASQLPGMEGLSFAGFPKTIITSGGREVLADQISILKDRMRRDLGDALVHHEMDEAPHDTLVMPWFEPERSTALGRLAEWIDC